MSQTNRVAVELCAGMGGMGIGLRALGFTVAKAYDVWQDAVDVYNVNAPEAVASQRSEEHTSELQSQ